MKERDRRPREQRFTIYGDRCIHGKVSRRFAAFSHELAVSGSSSSSSRTTIPNNSNINSSSNIPLQKDVDKAKKGSCTLREMKEDDAFVETEKAKKNRKGLLAMPKASIRKDENRRRRAALQLELERLELDLGVAWTTPWDELAPWSSELATRAAQIANAILIEDEDLCVRVAAAQDAVDELTEHV
jgi:hypothetical protein